MAQWSHYSELKLDPEWALIVQQIPKLPLTCNEIPSRRSEINETKRMELITTKYPKDGLSVHDRRIPITGGTISIRIYIPDGTGNETFPVLVNYHGGGYCFGDLNTDEVKCREACIAQRLSVVNVDYRLAPEYPWPTGINDSYDALKWVTANLSDIKGDISKGLLLGGSSAGANFVCILTQRAHIDPGLRGKITGQILQVPNTCLSDVDGVCPPKFASQLLSHFQLKDDLFADRSFVQSHLEAYKPGAFDDPEVSPLMANSFADLPPAFLQIAGSDPLRDQGLLYEQLLRKSGVPTKMEIYEGVGHGFTEVAPHIKVSLRWKQDLGHGIRWLLGRRDAQILA